MTQIPHGPADKVCPLHRQKMEKVCHKCPWWMQLRGKNPQTNKEIDEWNCSIAILPMLQLETSQQVRQAGAATESFRNEVVRRADSQQRVQAVRLNPTQLAPMIEVFNDGT